MNTNHIQQGDVILKRMTKMPRTAKLLQRGRIVLSEGSSSGNIHYIPKSASLYEDQDKKRYLKVSQTTSIQHNEHKPTALNPGIWLFDKVVQKDWLSGLVSPVVD